jgi:hypothetical protein
MNDCHLGSNDSRAAWNTPMRSSRSRPFWIQERENGYEVVHGPNRFENNSGTQSENVQETADLYLDFPPLMEEMAHE